MGKAFGQAWRKQTVRLMEGTRQQRRKWGNVSHDNTLIGIRQGQWKRKGRARR